MNNNLKIIIFLVGLCLPIWLIVEWGTPKTQLQSETQISKEATAAKEFFNSLNNQKFHTENINIQQTELADSQTAHEYPRKVRISERNLPVEVDPNVKEEINIALAYGIIDSEHLEEYTQERMDLIKLEKEKQQIDSDQILNE